MASDGPERDECPKCGFLIVYTGSHDQMPYCGRCGADVPATQDVERECPGVWNAQQGVAYHCRVCRTTTPSAEAEPYGDPATYKKRLIDTENLLAECVEAMEESNMAVAYRDTLRRAKVRLGLARDSQGSTG